MSVQLRLREVLDGLPTYKPGKAVVSPDGRSYKLSSNESPFETPPSVVAAITAAAAQVNRYPDPGTARLTEALARRHNVPESHIALSAGSVTVTQQLLEAIGEPGAEVVYGWRSFEAYPVLCELAGVKSVRVALHDETHDLDAMADAITDRTRLVIVCNPNNPTGTAVRRADLEAFLDRVPESCIVVIDEAYREYVRDHDVPDGLTLYPNRPNVAVLRTFSKAYGLAGLRVGYLIGNPAVAEAARKTAVPFAVNHIAQAAALAALDAEGELLDRVEVVVKERARVVETLLSQRWKVPPTEANFVWLRLREATLAFAEHCAGYGVAVRPFAGEGARISIGDAEANDAFLTAASTFRPTPA